MFESHNLRLENVVIRAGESAIKECSNIEAIDCRFEGNYPFWHVHGFVIDRCFFDIGGRSALWYSDHLKMTEPDAHRYIEKQAMDRCISKREVAEEIMKTYT